ncbi:hypothetical protein K2173_021730 [Erythroxylum novogranatense]|uniref:Uncharacterized protein n=1 Tax=Erythroxylum novogranatense TaxID=1862640 RepID=A0AAV8THI9_9ROSI|nr:hypothetical protein K2173_021730 [Erythroxylum novogranatense]
MASATVIEARNSKPSDKPDDGDTMLGEFEFNQGLWQMGKVKNMKATLTLRNFGGWIGRKATKCEEKYYTNFRYVVAMPSKWFQNKKRCNKLVEIKRNERSVTAEVVDECDSGSECRNSSIGATVAVWNALNIEWRGSANAAVDVTWSDV